MEKDQSFREEYNLITFKAEVDQAKRRRICKAYEDEHVIKKGELCVKFSSGPTCAFTFCMPCATDRFNEAKETIEDLLADIVHA